VCPWESIAFLNSYIARKCAVCQWQDAKKIQLFSVEEKNMPKVPPMVVKLTEEEYTNVRVAVAKLGYRSGSDLGRAVVLAWLRGDLAAIPSLPAEGANGATHGGLSALNPR
jgi:hypothetical protein